jgi:hypothetical protein
MIDGIFEGVMNAIKDYPSNLVLSVLIQVLYQSIPGEELTEEQSMDRMNAMVGLINIMRDGYAKRPRDNVSLGKTTEDLLSIARCGSRPVIAPALAFTLVSVVANGRRNAQAESIALEQIGRTLESFEAFIGPEDAVNG